MPFVDSDTHDQRLRALPNPTAWIWDEIHPAGGPPNWDHNLYWPWENVRVLLTFVPSRMRSVPDNASATNASATSTCESPWSSTTESATADGILLWVSKGKLLPYW